VVVSPQAASGIWHLASGMCRMQRCQSRNRHRGPP
jgi:hypothetical protein